MGGTILTTLKQVPSNRHIANNTTTQLHITSFLNQARAWFLRIDPVRIVGMRVRVRVCVCVRARGY